MLLSTDNAVILGLMMIKTWPSHWTMSQVLLHLRYHQWFIALFSIQQTDLTSFGSSWHFRKDGRCFKWKWLTTRACAKAMCRSPPIVVYFASQKFRVRCTLSTLASEVFCFFCFLFSFPAPPECRLQLQRNRKLHDPRSLYQWMWNNCTARKGDF